MEQSEIQVTNSQGELTLHVTCPLMLEEDHEKMVETMMEKAESLEIGKVCMATF